MNSKVLKNPLEAIVGNRIAERVRLDLGSCESDDLKRIYKKAGEELLTRTYGNRIRGDAFKLKEGRFR